MDKYAYGLNNERLKRYIVNNKNNINDIIGMYLFNIELSKELYALIALTEVTLRNHINNAISTNIKDKWLLDVEFIETFLKDNELNRYLELYKTLDKKQRLTEGRLIAELSLGFWVNLFDKKYKIGLWHKKNVFETIFPHFDVKISNRIGFIYPKLKDLQYIRNRISHHEPIFDHPKGLNNSYNDILLLLSWLSPEIKETALKVCKFDYIWKEKLVNI